jgi:segregation and condensation protein B
MREEEIKRALEAVFFVSPKPVTMQQLQGVFTDTGADVIKQAIYSMQNELAQRNSSLRIEEVAGGFQMTTSADVAEYIKNLFYSKSKHRISPAALETLAIIAYRQPITKSEIEFIRGVQTDGVVATLLEKEFIRAVGHKESPGRPVLYGTTKIFLEVFGIKDLASLPPLKEFTEQDVHLPEGFDQTQTEVRDETVNSSEQIKTTD